MRARVIPVLLLAGSGLVKTIRFKGRAYIGDPINAVRLFNDMEVDEIIVLDIEASREGREPDLSFVKEFASEAFMPFGFGGGITTIDQMARLFNLGAEKVILNHCLLTAPSLLGEAAQHFGNQAIVAAVDVKRDFFGRHKVYDRIAGKLLSASPVDYAKWLETSGAGEILINDVDRDGTMKGYDNELIRTVACEVGLPVIACGGAGNLGHLGQAAALGAAAAAGSLFVYKGAQKGVLINYPSQWELDAVLGVSHQCFNLSKGTTV